MMARYHTVQLYLNHCSRPDPDSDGSAAPDPYVNPGPVSGREILLPPKKGEMKKFHFEKKVSVGLELLLDPECPL
jgi:hypothetical protein